MRKNYYLVLDVETANSTEDALVYDLGFAVCDKKGIIYEADSFVVTDIFFDERELMESAYYAKKLPQYFQGIKEKTFKVRSFYQVREILRKILLKYSITAVCAYNADFDTRALNTTQRWLTKSKYRFFLPYGTKIFCIWNMACQTICLQKSYVKFCLENGLVSNCGNIKTSAETVYAYLTDNADFNEEHTGLRDVLIEVQIMAHCFRQHKRMEKGINRLCWRIPQPQAKAIAKGAE
jgi:hypothetical protein